MSTHVRLLGHFARNRRVRPTAKPRVDRQRLTTDPDLGREVAATIGKQLLENPPVGNSVDEVEAEFTAAIMQTAEIVMPLKERKRRGEDGAETPKRRQNLAW